MKYQIKNVAYFNFNPEIYHPDDCAVILKRHNQQVKILDSENIGDEILYNVKFPDGLNFRVFENELKGEL